jgi:hypothetical protein
MICQTFRKIPTGGPVNTAPSIGTYCQGAIEKPFFDHRARAIPPSSSERLLNDADFDGVARPVH